MTRRAAENLLVVPVEVVPLVAASRILDDLPRLSMAHMHARRVRSTSLQALDRRVRIHAMALQAPVSIRFEHL